MFRRLLPLILACLVALSPYAIVHAAPISQQQTLPTLEGRVNTTANIRSGPGTNYAVVTQAQPGESILVVGCNEDCTWFQLDNGNWIAAFLVDLVGMPDEVESSDQTTPPTQPGDSDQPSTRRTQIVDPSQLELHEPSQTALDIVGQILSYTGLPQNFDLYSANIYNAAALMLRGKRVILYDPQLIADIESVSDHDWPAVSILAHEIGHHLAGHTLSRAYDKEFELEADYFSGFILQKMGASVAEAQTVMNFLQDHANMTDHPPQAERLAAIAAGWQESARQDELAAWQPDFPDFAQEVAYDSQAEPLSAEALTLLSVLRQAQGYHLATVASLAGSAPRDWSLGLKAFVD